MKKLLLITSALLIVFSAAACGGKTQINENKNVILLNGFEDYKNDVEPLVLLNYFGKVSRNSDKNYVKSGDYSLKLYPAGDNTQSGLDVPRLRQPLDLKAKQLDFSDISSVTKFSLSAYNSEDYDVNMYLEMQFGTSYVNKSSYILKSGWNSVIYSCDPQIIGISYDVDDCKGLIYSFDKAAAAPTIFIDDLTVYTTEKQYEKLDLDLAANEIISFDKLYQEYVVIPNSVYSRFAPIISLNSNPSFAKSGFSMKAELVPNDGTYETSYARYTGFTISEKYINQVGFDKYADDDIFTFSIYNAGQTTQRLFFEMFRYTDKGTYYKETGIYVKPSEWYTYSVTISDINKQRVGGVKSKGTGDAGAMYFSYELNSLSQSKTLYFDDFRIIKAEK